MARRKDSTASDSGSSLLNEGTALFRRYLAG